MQNKPAHNDINAYRSIRYLNLFRLLLGLFFFSIIFKEVEGFIGVGYTQNIARIIAGFYLAFSVLIWIISYLYKSQSTTIGVAALVVDLPFIISLTLLFGGLHNGWVILATITIGSFSILNHKSWSIFAMPIIAVSLLFIMPKFLGLERSIVQFSNIFLYALTYFGIAFVGIGQSQSYNQSQLLAKLQRRKITDLSMLNRLIIAQMNSGDIAYDDSYQVIFSNKQANDVIKTNTGEQLPKTLIKAIIATPVKKSKSITIYGEDLLFNIVQAKDTSKVSLLFLEKQSQINEKSQTLNLATIGQLSATIAHELRNPMAAIYSAAQLLEESENISKEDTELTEIITKQIERSNRIIEDILLMSKPQVAEQIIINLHSKISRFKTNFYKQKSISAKIMTVEPFDESLTISFDNSHLSQLLWNLTENALKHGTDGKVKIMVHNLADSVLIDIMNTGSRFEPIIEESLFTPFFTTHTKGTGLGLYICREMCKSNNAKLEYLWQDFHHVFRIHVKKY